MPGKNPPFLLLARCGFAARGFMYLLVAWLALRLGRTEDPGGALAYLGSGGGRAVLAAMALGFAGYAAWRLVDAALATEGRDGLGHRLAAAGSGAVHLGFAVTAARLALGGGGSGGGAAEQGAKTAMTFPGGSAMLLAAAAALAAAALFQFVVAARRRFLRHMAAEAARRWWIVALGTAGYATRGLLFAVAAWLMVGAATHHRPGEAGGLGDSLEALPAGVGAAVAAGLAMFGLFSLVEAWYRVMRDPHLKGRLKSAAA
ncbi:MAG: DUF1206 domain-containing protein [Alphaproteobacteria bacterium]|nr:DUF1206 domain-containing protein [Alphaproteobacteria bacterium]MBV9373378.1 DUF1206 domain-containing protein [Alphaproteobacteria bacterium]MBV9902581.1 DUF1206 domain-containing protein [Alphaproteobacteria bacterium]